MTIICTFDGYDYRDDRPTRPLRAYVWRDEITGNQYRELFETEADADAHQTIAEGMFK